MPSVMYKIKPRVGDMRHRASLFYSIWSASDFRQPQKQKFLRETARELALPLAKAHSYSNRSVVRNTVVPIIAKMKSVMAILMWALILL